MKALFTFMLTCTIIGSLQAQNELKAGDCTLEVPSAFKLVKDDGTSDMLEVRSNCEMKEFQFTMFNRWGSKASVIKNVNSPTELKDLTEGVYVWMIKGTTENGDEFNFSGNITILK